MSARTTSRTRRPPVWSTLTDQALVGDGGVGNRGLADPVGGGRPGSNPAGGPRPSSGLCSSAGSRCGWGANATAAARATEPGSGSASTPQPASDQLSQQRRPGLTARRCLGPTRVRSRVEHAVRRGACQPTPSPSRGSARSAASVDPTDRALLVNYGTGRRARTTSRYRPEPLPRSPRGCASCGSMVRGVLAEHRGRDPRRVDLVDAVLARRVTAP